jgi:hypothetical protein
VNAFKRIIEGERSVIVNYLRRIGREMCLSDDEMGAQWMNAADEIEQNEHHINRALHDEAM